MTARDGGRDRAGPAGEDSGDRHWRLVRADSGAVPGSVRSATERPAARRRRLALRLAAGAAVLALLGTGCWLVYGTEVFAVTQVRVTGTRLLSAEQVRQAADVRPGTPLARLDTGAVGDRVARLAPVAVVSVRRDWPDTVVIRVTERTPVAVVRSRDRFLVLDGTGVVFHTVARRPRHLPLVQVAHPGPDDPTTRDALHVLESLTPQLRSVLVKLVAESPTRITLRLTKRRSVVWGDAEHSEQKAQVATVLLARPVRVIDVSAPDVVTTR